MRSLQKGKVWSVQFWMLLVTWLDPRCCPNSCLWQPLLVEEGLPECPSCVCVLWRRRLFQSQEVGRHLAQTGGWVSPCKNVLRNADDLSISCVTIRKYLTPHALSRKEVCLPHSFGSWTSKIGGLFLWPLVRILWQITSWLGAHGRGGGSWGKTRRQEDARVCCFLKQFTVKEFRSLENHLISFKGQHP